MTKLAAVLIGKATFYYFWLCGHFINQHPTSQQTPHIPHSQYATSLAYHIPNILHLVRQMI